MSYQELKKRIRVWAADQPAVRAVVVIGSRARKEPAADVWSDLDLLLFTTEVDTFAQEGAWLGNFGQVWLKALQKTGAGYPEWLVLYEGGYKVDFLLVPASGSVTETVHGSVFGKVSRRGFRILIDKGEAEPAPVVGNFEETVFSETVQFETAVQLFWISAYRAACMLRRGDLWRARQTMDINLRCRLVQMLAWHAQVMNDNGIDTWFDGRFMEQWADPRAVAALPRLFAPFEYAATVGALKEYINLYVWLAEETAVRHRYRYPDSSIRQVNDWIAATLKEMI